MRWTAKRNYNPGDKRVLKRFAFLPKQIGHTKVWLEFYSEYQVFRNPNYWEVYKLDLGIKS